ncbi:MAG: hypothetical protein HY870_18165 [Chloroflexi bacterium]|nr:hypothetical protein [Chloroflexota bacterium]
MFILPIVHYSIFRELVDLEATPSRLMYSYHYQRADASLVFRYDDTPHYPELPGFPHHKHADSEPAVLPVPPPDLVAVLDEIERIGFASDTWPSV